MLILEIYQREKNPIHIKLKFYPHAICLEKHDCFYIIHPIFQLRL